MVTLIEPSDTGKTPTDDATSSTSATTDSAGAGGFSEDIIAKKLENEIKQIEIDNKRLEFEGKKQEIEEGNNKRKREEEDEEKGRAKRARTDQADELEKRANRQQKRVDALQKKEEKEKKDEKNAEKKAAKEKSDRLWGYSKMSIAAVVAVILLAFFVMYKINEGHEAARIKLPDAYTKIFNGPLLGKAVQGTVSFTGMEKDRVETCASICKKLFTCRGFNYKAEKCEIVTSESIFPTVVDSPGSAAYEKK